MNIVKRAKLDFNVLVQSLAIIFLITTEISADSNTPKNPAPTQPNPKNSAVTPNKQRPPISEGSKPSNPNPPKDKANNPPVSIPEVVKPKPIPLPKKPNDPPVSIPEVVKPKPIPLPKKPNDPPVSIPEVVKPAPTPVPLRRPIVSDKKPLPPTGATKAPIQEPPPGILLSLIATTEETSLIIRIIIINKRSEIFMSTQENTLSPFLGTKAIPTTSTPTHG